MSTPPHDTETEKVVLGAVLSDPRAFDAVLPILSGADFYQPAHEIVWNAAKTLRTQGDPVDANTVGNALTISKQAQLVGGLVYLIELVHSTVVTVNADHHALIIKDLSVRRRLIDRARSNLQDAEQSTDPVEAILSRQEERLRSVPTVEPDYVGTLMSFDEFCDQTIPDDDWIIPGLLNRGDRLILTGGEGLGKSILMRQFAVSVAAGVHPFTYQPIPVQTVMYVDVENPKRIMVKTFSEMRAAVRRNRGPMDEKRLWIERIPAGLDLGEASDRLWLQRLVSLVNPDLLCIGPAYKLYRGSKGDKDEDLARQVTSSLDAIRESVNCALILEHHSGHGTSGAIRDVRPFGSSLWLRWPEFGYGIRAVANSKKEDRLVDFVGWRGPRDEREWPEQIQAGTNFMPWIMAQ